MLWIVPLAWFVLIAGLTLALMPEFHQKQSALLLAALAVVTALVYRHVLMAGFVYEDMNWLPTLGDPIAPGFLALVDVPWMAANRIGAGFPWAYHAMVLLVHLVNGLLLFQIATAFGLSPFAAVCAVGLFWLHPVNSEAVAYLSGARETLATFWLLLGLNVLLLPIGAFWRVLGLCLGLALGLTAKASMAPAVLLVPAVGAYLTHQKRLAQIIGAAMLGCVALLSVPVLSEVARQSHSEGTVYLGLQGVTHYAAFTSAALVRYLAMIPVPYGLSVDHDWRAVNAIWTTLALGGLLVYGAALVLYWRRVPVLAAISLWVVVAILPRFFVQQEEILNEHQIYFAFLPIWVGLGMLIDHCEWFHVRETRYVW